MVVCVVLATTFWFLRAMDNQYTTNISFPFEIITDTNYVSIGEQPEKIQINVSGYGWTLFKKSLGIGKKKLYFKLSQASNPSFINGTELYPYIADKVKGIRVNFVKTENIELNFDEKAKKEVLLKFKYDVDKSFFKEVPKLRLEDKKIKLIGAQSDIETIPNELILEAKRNQFEEEQKIVFDIYDYIPERVISSDTLIECSYEIYHYIIVQLQKNVKLKNVPSSLEPSEDDVILKIELEKENVEKLKGKDFEVSADYYRRKSDSTKVKIRYKGNVKLKSLESQPAYIHFSK